MNEKKHVFKVFAQFYFLNKTNFNGAFGTNFDGKRSESAQFSCLRRRLKRGLLPVGGGPLCELPRLRASAPLSSPSRFARRYFATNRLRRSSTYLQYIIKCYRYTFPLCSQSLVSFLFSFFLFFYSFFCYKLYGVLACMCFALACTAVVIAWPNRLAAFKMCMPVS